ncbi:MAG: hypothetical protein DIKNOCCD_02306 [bacterium]|nr:hypothetical protein [bacterium]
MGAGGCDLCNKTISPIPEAGSGTARDPAIGSAITTCKDIAGFVGNDPISHIIEFPSEVS